MPQMVPFKLINIIYIIFNFISVFNVIIMYMLTKFLLQLLMKNLLKL